MGSLCFLAWCLFYAPEISDGDTFTTGVASVRVWGISAPERYHDAGPASTASLDDIVGAALICRDTGDRTWGRVVGQCWTLDGTDIACAQVERGHATDWPEYSEGYYARCEK